MGLQRLLLLTLTAGVIGAAGTANAAYSITGIDIYGNGVVTASDPGGPPVGRHDYFHVSVLFFPPYPGNPYAPIPTDATGTFHFLTNSGPLDGFNVTITDFFSYAPCEFCVADFSLVNGEMSGPFSFAASVFDLGYSGVTDSSFFAEIPRLGPDSSTAHYRGTFAANRIAIHTDAPIPVPEPASWVLMLAGFLGAGQALRRMARRASRRRLAIAPRQLGGRASMFRRSPNSLSVV